MKISWMSLLDLSCPTPGCTGLDNILLVISNKLSELFRTCFCLQDGCLYPTMQQFSRVLPGFAGFYRVLRVEPGPGSARRTRPGSTRRTGSSRTFTGLNQSEGSISRTFSVLTLRTTKNQSRDPNKSCTMAFLMVLLFFSNFCIFYATSCPENCFCDEYKAECTIENCNDEVTTEFDQLIIHGKLCENHVFILSHILDETEIILKDSDCGTIPNCR